MIRHNKTKRRLAAGETVFGTYLPIAAPEFVELCGLSGLDFVYIDAEHGAIDPVACTGLVRAAELADVTPIVRVPYQPAAILQYLDIGVQGVMVPHVASREDAERVVAATKYAPIGKRGAAAARAAAYGQQMSSIEWPRWANNEIMTMAMIEDVEALSNLAEILRVPGIDAFELGPEDLSHSMGFPGDRSHPEVQEALNTIIATLRDAGRVFGDTVGSVEEAGRVSRRGYRMISCSFVTIATSAVKNFVTGMRDEVRKAPR